MSSTRFAGNNNRQDERGRQQAVLEQQLSLLYRNIPAAVFTNALAALLVVYAFWAVVSHSLLLAWLAAVALIGFARLILRHYWNNHADALGHRNWQLLFVTGTAVAGLTWAAISFPLFAVAGARQQLFLAFVYVGLSAGAITILSYLRSAAMAYILPLLTVLVYHFARQGDVPGGVMALAGLFFLIGLAFTAQRTYGYMIENVQLSTAHRVQQQELADNEARYHTLLDTAVDAFFLHDDKGRFVDANKMACSSLGYSYDELMALTVFDIEEHAQPDALDGMWSRLKQGDVETVQGVHQRKNGSAFPVEVRIGVIGNETGGKLFSVLARDMTQRELAEEARRLSESRLEEAQKIAHLGYWEMDMTSGEIIWSDEIYRIFGVTREGFAPDQSTFSEYLHPQDREKMQTSYEAGLAGEKYANEEWRIIHPVSGVMKYIHVLAERFFDEAGRFVYMIGTLQDITLRKQAEKAKDEFISTVSHELRTPLTSIRGAVGLLRGGAAGEIPEQARAMLDVAGNNTERLLLLINDILDIQKIESGELGLQFRAFELTPWLQQAIEEHSGYAQQHQIQYRLQAPSRDCRIYGDPDRLMQVLGNLLSNAAKFSPAHSDIRIHTSTHDNRVRIHVCDSGPGIPDSFRDKLFDKFTQSDATTTRTAGGTGLGLSIARAIMDRHQGAIGFQSTEGQGSEFWFEVGRADL